MFVLPCLNYSIWFPSKLGMRWEDVGEGPPEKSQVAISCLRNTVHQTSIYYISRWFRCRHPVSRPVTVVSWRHPPWIPGNSTKQSAWRRTWRNYWFSGDGMFYCDTVSVRVRGRNTVSCQSEKFMTYCLPSPFLRMVARYSLPHMHS